jgi:hypothetical protein
MSFNDSHQWLWIQGSILICRVTSSISLTWHGRMTPANNSYLAMIQSSIRICMGSRCNTRVFLLVYTSTRAIGSIGYPAKPARRASTTCRHSVRHGHGVWRGRGVRRGLPLVASVIHPCAYNAACYDWVSNNAKFCSILISVFLWL